MKATPRGVGLKRLFYAAAILLTRSMLSAQSSFIAVDFGNYVYAINPTTGSGSLVGMYDSIGLNALAADNSGKLFAAGGAVGVFPAPPLVTIDPATGRVVSSTPLDFGNRITSVRALAFSPDGLLYAINNGGGFGIPEDELYTINLSTGMATLLGSTGLDGIQGLDFSPQGVLYGWDAGFEGLVRINPVTGRATDVDPAVGGTPGIQSIVFAPDGNLYGANNALYRIDVASGALTLIGSGGYSDIRGIEVIPEPSPLSLLLTGVWIGILVRSRQRANQSRQPTPVERQG